MKKVYLLFPLFLLSFMASASQKPRVVLLSSLKTPKIWYHSKDWKIEKPLKNIFHQAFDETDYEVIIKERVEPGELREELLNPLNMAVFWISHAAGLSSSSSGISTKGAVLDIEPRNVASLFKDIHPNLHYLALIGCDGLDIINHFIDEGYLRDNINLKMTSFDRKIDARKGLRKAIRESEGILGDLKTYKRRIGRRNRVFKKNELFNSSQYIKDFYRNNICEQEEVIELTLTREVRKDTPASVVFLNGFPIHHFPKSSGEIEQSKNVKVSSTLFQLNNKISHDSLKDFSKKRIELGRLSISSHYLDGDWDLFSTSTGRAIGISRNLYRFKGIVVDQKFDFRHQCLAK